MYFAFAFEHHEDAEADVVGDLRAVPSQGGDDFDLPFVVKHSAFLPGSHQRGDLVDRPGRVRSPSGAGVRPVALHTAVVSKDGFEPSRKELNIFGLRPPSCACSGVSP